MGMAFEDKHAYLIMTHNDFESLKYLLKALDDERNDIYIHVDKKSKNVDLDLIRSWVCKAGLFFMPRHKIYWGHTSMIKCEFQFLKLATSRCHYKYYHLISGVDFPLKSQDEIHDFFKDKDLEYLAYHEDGVYGDHFMYKIKYYYLFMRWVGRIQSGIKGYKKVIIDLLCKLERKSLKIQKKIGVDRTKKHNLHFVKGDNWFSITDDFARYVVSKEAEIKKIYAFTNCTDEIFMVTLAFNSYFKNRIAGTCLREIDWKRGKPYEFKYGDLEHLKKSSKMFSRKISFSHEPELVCGLMKHIGVM